jgi:hypothetical protein
MLASAYSSLTSLYLQNGLQSLNFLLFAGVYFAVLLSDFAGENIDDFESKMIEAGTKGRLLGLIFMCYCLITGTTTYLFSLARAPPSTSPSLLPILLLLPLTLLLFVFPPSSIVIPTLFYFISLLLISIYTTSIPFSIISSLPPSFLKFLNEYTGFRYSIDSLPSPSPEISPAQGFIPMQADPSQSLLPPSASLILLLLLIFALLILHSIFIANPPASFILWLGFCMGGGLGFVGLVGRGRRMREERRLVMAAHFGLGTVVMMSLPIVIKVTRELLLSRE